MDTREILEDVEANQDKLKFNRAIFEILEGGLIKHIDIAIEDQNTGGSVALYKQRSAPINVLNKVIDKLSGLYENNPVRTTELPSDQELVDHYTEELNLDEVMGDANAAYNAYKAANVEIFEDGEEGEEELAVRSLSGHKYVPYSSSESNPMRLTEMVKIMDKKVWIYSKDEFKSVNEEGNEVKADYAENGGVNPYGIIPFIYRSKSRHLLMPINDSDTYKMVVLIPILIGDINTASQFMSSPIMYGIDISAEELKKQPNAFWNLKSGDVNKPGQVGVIEAKPDIPGQLQLIKEELALWLQSKNIKPGAIGTLTVETAASGISLMIQEMDTTKDVKKQSKVFKGIEREFWKKLAIMHNKLLETGRVTGLGKFSDDVEVAIDYGEISAIQSEVEVVDVVIKKLDKNLITKEMAVKKLGPKLTPEQIQEILAEGEKSLTIIAPKEETDA